MLCLKLNYLTIKISRANLIERNTQTDEGSESGANLKLALLFTRYDK